MSSKPHKDLVRFWSAVNIGDPESCWSWQGTRDRDGYGVFKYLNKNRRAHRVVYGLTHGGEQPRVVMHTCDNPACCNPDHLRGGSQSQNMQDKVRKDRQARGSKNGRAKLTEREVRGIKWVLFWNNSSYAEIARRYKVSKSVIRDINRKKTWKHVNKIGLEDIRVEPVQ